jgi:DNA-binding NarL/FixJ family response regulator
VPRSVLIVDDSQPVRAVIRDFLETRTDWNIAGEAQDGADAIQKAIKLKPDLILLDFLMPTMNGMETASVLKKMMPDVRIVVFTMFDQALGETLRSAVGVDLVLPKPDGLTSLVKSVERLMETAGLATNNVE